LPHKQTCLSPVYQDTPTPEGCDKIILIGASTGGPPALNFILSNLPKNMPFPLLIVQHIEEGFTHGLVNWLQQNSKLQVRVAQDYESISKGVVYFPPDNSFMGIAQSGRISLNPLLKNQAHTHTIDFLMTSASEVFNNSCIGILLTGMGNDGARGMKTIRDRGGRTSAQDEESSLIFGMPQKAIKNNGADKISPLKQIPQEIMSFCTPTLDQRVS
ncbi:MAG: CheB methylesterase domain-containing protein, partial [Nitrospinota bacterium]